MAAARRSRTGEDKNTACVGREIAHTLTIAEREQIEFRIGRLRAEEATQRDRQYCHAPVIKGWPPESREQAAALDRNAFDRETIIFQPSVKKRAQHRVGRNNCPQFFRYDNRRSPLGNADNLAARGDFGPNSVRIANRVEAVFAVTRVTAT